jgi:hypothetical protein
VIRLPVKESSANSLAVDATDSGKSYVLYRKNRSGGPWVVPMLGDLPDFPSRIRPPGCVVERTWQSTRKYFPGSHSGGT